MNRDKFSTVFDKAKQVFPLMRFDLAVIRIEQYDVKELEIFSIAKGLFHRSDVVEINYVMPQSFGQHGIIYIGGMVLNVVPEKEDSYRSDIRTLGGWSSC